jgi:Tetratricopeptide repeat
MSESDVAMWHRLSGMPDNVTEDGEVVAHDPSSSTRSEKAFLRTAIARWRENGPTDEARSLARLAGSYLLAGDTETARRYLERAQDQAPSTP